MRRKITVTLAIVVVLLFCVALYFIKFRGGNACSLVPDDATGVAVLDIREMVEESDIDNAKLKSIDNKTGIDFTKRLYCFLTMNGNVGIAAMVASEDDLDAGIEDKRMRSGLTFGMVGSFLTCHDDRRILLMGPMASINDEALQDEMIALMDKENSKCSLLDSLEGQESPLAIRMTVETLPERLRNVIMPALSQGFDLSKVQIAMDTRMKEKQISFRTRVVTPSSVVNKYLDELLGCLKPMDASLLSIKSPSPVVWLGMGVKGDKMLDALRKNETCRNVLLGLNMNIDADMIIRAIDGDLYLNISELTMHRQSFLLLSHVTDMEFMKNRNDWNTVGANLHIGMADDNTLYVTNYTDYIPNTAIFSPNVTLQTSYNDIKGSKLYLRVETESLLNVAAPMLAALGYSKRFYDTIGSVSAVSFRITDDSAWLEVNLNMSLNDIIGKWIE